MPRRKSGHLGVMQAQARPLAHSYAVAPGNRRYNLVAQEELRPKAIPRILTEGIAPEQAVVEVLCAG
jgi:hypothetical protein